MGKMGGGYTVAPRLRWKKATAPDTVGKQWLQGPCPNETKFETRDSQTMKTAYGPLAYVSAARQKLKREWELKRAWPGDIRKLRALAKTSSSFIERERIEKRIRVLQQNKGHPARRP